MARTPTPTLARYVGAPGRWCATLLLMMAENLGDRYKRTRLATLVAILEPLGIICMFALVHALITVRPPFGSSFLLFFATGILPFYLFFHVSWRIRTWDALRRLPRTTDIDLLLSHVLDEFLVKLVIMTICYVGLWMMDVREAIPQDPLRGLMALATITLIGIGIGFLNAVVSSFFFAWLYIYAVAIRGWMAFSGVLFVVDWMPPPLREIAVYNPLSHAITWYRASHYAGYPTVTFDGTYLAATTAAILALGWLALVATRPWRAFR